MTRSNITSSMRGKIHQLTEIIIKHKITDALERQRLSTEVSQQTSGALKLPSMMTCL